MNALRTHFTQLVVPHRTGDKSACETMTLYVHLSCGSRTAAGIARATVPQRAHHKPQAARVCKLQLNNGEKYGGTQRHAALAWAGETIHGHTFMATAALPVIPVRILFGSNAARAACCVNTTAVWRCRHKRTACGDKIAFLSCLRVCAVRACVGAHVSHETFIKVKPRS